MSIRIACLTVLVKKSALRRAYPGGVEAFARDFRHGDEDARLLAFAFMASAEAWAFLDVLAAMGLRPGRDVALGDAFIGPLQPCAGIAFAQEEGCLMGGWHARAGSPGEPRTMDT